MNFLTVIEERVIGLIRILLGLVMVSMVILNLANAAGRYVGTPIFTGADELLVFGMIWLVMIGAVVSTRERKHLSIDVFPQRLDDKSRLLLNTVVGIFTVVLATFIAFHSLHFINKISAIGQTSMGMGVPMVIPHFAVFTGFSGIALVTGILAIKDFRELIIRRRG